MLGKSEYVMHKQLYSHFIIKFMMSLLFPGVAAPLPPAQQDQTEFSLDKSITLRNYQRELAEPGVRGDNYLVVAPTGTGKTMVAAMVIANHLMCKDRRGVVIFMTHTRVLAQQQAVVIKEAIPSSNVSTGRDNIMLHIVMQKSKPDIVVCTAGKLLYELESKSEHISIKDISLLVVDECHHVVGSSSQAQVMEKYLEAKFNEEIVPQVIGLTASPGAGDNPRFELSETLNHLIKLCARMNAYGGIKTVKEHASELETFTNKPDTNLQKIESRNQSELLIQEIVKEMTQLEPSADFHSRYPHWSQEYETKVQEQKKLLQESLDPAHRDAISTLELLRCYCLALNIYMDLRKEDALLELEEYAYILPSPKQRTPHENMLANNLDDLITRIKRMPTVCSQLLNTAGAILHHNFSSCPDAQAIFFVHTKKHARGAHKWLSTLPLIKPIVITGNSGSTGHGMTDAEKDQALQDFHKGTYNVLVATSVAEEGIDIPACNLVIRYLHITNEIARVQASGRARAMEASAYTIVQSNSSNHLREMKNKELDFLVNEALFCFPDSDLLKQKISAFQPGILDEREMKMRFAAEKARRNDRSSCKKVRLFCIGCKALACEGSDIYTAERSNHYVVPGEHFKERYITKPHQKSKTIPGIIPFEKTHKLHCAECSRDWGVICVWKIAKDYELPVIKSSSFIFEIDGHKRLIKKWSDAPFEIPPLSKQSKYEEFAIAD